LLTYSVCFAEPGEHFSVEIFFPRNSELIDVVVWQKEFHSREAWTVEPVLEPKATDKTILRDTRNSREARPRLEADPRLVDIHFHGSAFTHHLQKDAVEPPVSGSFLPEEIRPR
jgi:hypothetical protein